MIENIELHDAVRGLQTQTDALQTQPSELLLALADQSETMRTIQKQYNENLLAFWTMIQ